MMRILARLLLRGFPRDFREHVGDDYLATADSWLAAPGHAGWRGRMRFATALCLDFVRSAPVAWQTSLGRAPRTPHPPRRRATRMDSLLLDLRFAVRALRRAPAFVAVVVLSLALGIGANALVFGALDGILLRPFDLPDPDRLVAVGAAHPSVAPGRRFIESLSPPELDDIREGVPSLEHVAAFDLGNRAIAGGDVPERVFTALVLGDLLATLGVQPALGRAIRADETTTPGNSVAMLSHRVWQSRFGGDTALVGRPVRVNGVAHTIVGILPPEVTLLGTDLWLPMGVPMSAIPRQVRNFALLGRVRADRSLDQVNAELARVASATATAWGAEHPGYAGWSLMAAPWHVALTSEDNVRGTGFVLQGAVFLLLLIAWVNIAGLVVARAAARHAELATRRALGATAGRVLRPLMVESVVLAVLGAAVGLGVCAILAPRLTELLPAALRNQGFEIAVNGRVAAVTFAGAVVGGVLLAFVPSGLLRRASLTSVLGQASGRTTAGHAASRLRAVFLAGQVALSIMLLTGAGLLVRSMQQLNRVDLGVDPDNVLTMRVSVPREQYADSAIVPLIERMEAGILAVPGVRSVGAATQFGVPNFMAAPVARPGGDRRMARNADISNVSSGYLKAMGHRLQAGRILDARDSEQAPRVAVINATAARRLFGEAAAIGEQLLLGDSARQVSVEVVGVVGDVRNRGLDAPVEPEVFVPARQGRVAVNNQFFLLIRTAGDPAAMVGAIRAAIREVDAEQPVYAISTLTERLGAAMVQRRAARAFLLVFACIALFLAAAGTYGMAAYAVAQRTREIGIRMALGADDRQVRGLVTRGAFRVVGIGVLAGVAGSLATSGALRAIVFGISATDVPTYLVAVALLTLTSLVAISIPLRVAVRVAPASVLRD